MSKQHRKAAADGADGTVATSVRLPADMRQRLETIANEERRTLGNVIRIALEDWLILRAKK
jgi:predicted DNA-binding protein